MERTRERFRLNKWRFLHRKFINIPTSFSWSLFYLTEFFNMVAVRNFRICWDKCRNSTMFKLCLIRVVIYKNRSLESEFSPSVYESKVSAVKNNVLFVLFSPWIRPTHILKWTEVSIFTFKSLVKYENMKICTPSLNDFETMNKTSICTMSFRILSYIKVTFRLTQNWILFFFYTVCSPWLASPWLQG